MTRVASLRKDSDHGHILIPRQNSPELKGILGQLGAAVIPAVLGEVMGNGGQGQACRRSSAKLEQAGLGDQVKSWIGNGQNLPITADQLQQVLGSDTVKQLAARFSIPVDQLARCWRGAAGSRSTVRALTAKLPHAPELAGTRESMRAAGNSRAGTQIAPYRPEKPRKNRTFVMLPILLDFGALACWLPQGSQMPARLSGQSRSSQRISEKMAEGVEAQVLDWRDGHFTASQRGAPSRERHLPVIRLLPTDGDDCQYRIKSSTEAFERVAERPARAVLMDLCASWLGRRVPPPPAVTKAPFADPRCAEGRDCRDGRCSPSPL